MNKCELILAMIAGMFHAVFKGVKHQIYNNRVTANYELTVFIPKRGTFRPLVESIAHLVSEHLSVFNKQLPDSLGIRQWELADGAEDDICLNHEDYLLYTIRIVKIEDVVLARLQSKRKVQDMLLEYLKDQENEEYA